MGSGVNGLGVIRGFAKCNIPCYVITASVKDPVCYSRHPRKVTVVRFSGTTEKDQAYLDALRPYFGKQYYLIATQDDDINFILRNKSLLQENFKYLLPPDKVVEILLDKRKETTLLSSLEVPLPHTFQHFPSQMEEFLNRMELPVIIKPRMEVYIQKLGSKNIIINSKEELRNFYEDQKDNLDLYIAQEIISGSDESLWVCNCTFGYDHSLIQSFTFQRFRTAPAHYGVTSYAISKHNDQIVDSVAKIGKEFAYVGPAMMEFKYDEKDDRYKYIETNPRVGMCNYFDTICGINNVVASYHLALNGHYQPSTVSQKDNVVFLNLFDDFNARIRDGESVFKIIGHYLSNVAKKHVWAYWDWSDPKPGIIALRNKVFKFIKKN